MACLASTIVAAGPGHAPSTAHCVSQVLPKLEVAVVVEAGCVLLSSTSTAVGGGRLAS